MQLTNYGAATDIIWFINKFIT